MKKKLILFPYNGNAIEAIDCIGEIYDIIGFIDDNKDKHGSTSFGIQVYSREFFSQNWDTKVLAIPGNPKNFSDRRKIIENLGICADRFCNVIHPKANISKYATIGNNNLIMSGVSISPNVTIGNNVCILPNSVIHHDSTIGDYTLIGSNVSIAGFAQIGTCCYIGSGTRIINNVSIGNNTLVGLGSNVIRDVKESSRIVGNPSRKID